MKPALLASAALGFALAAPGLAQTQAEAPAPVDELGASIWHVAPFFEGVGFREALGVSADRVLAPAVRARAGLRVSSAAALRGALLSQPQVELLGSFHEIVPSVTVLAGGSLGLVRLQAGLGLSYQVRLTQTQDAAVGRPIVPGAPGFGTIKRLDLSFDPGAEALAELSVLTPAGFRVALGAGASAAPGRIFVQPRENANLAIAIPELFLTWSLQLGVSYELPPRR
jgi:hypothetical protein